MARGAQDYHQRIFSNDTLLGEDNIVAERNILGCPGGNVTRDVGAVPVGRFWKIQHISARDDNSAITGIEFALRFGVDEYVIRSCLNPGIAFLCEWDGTVWVDEGWFVVCHFDGTVAGDITEMFVNGVEVVKR